MKKATFFTVILSIIAVVLDAQSPGMALIYALNLASSKVDIRLGEETSRVFEMRDIPPGASQPMIEIPPATQVKLYMKPSAGSPASWEVLKRMGGDHYGDVMLFDAAADRVYGVIITPWGDGLNARMIDYTADAKGPMIQLANLANAPMKFGVGSDKGRWEGLEPSDFTGPGDVSRFQALKLAGTFGIFFESFLWDEGKNVFYSSKDDPKKPAFVSFRDGAFYVVVASLDGANPRFTFYEIPPAKAAAEKPAAQPLTFSSVPAAWNGEYEEARRPGRAALAVHDGKIWSVFGGGQTETFPGPSWLYRYAYGETECRSVYRDNGKEAERYLFDPKTGKITYYTEGAAPIVYVPMKK